MMPSHTVAANTSTPTEQDHKTRCRELAGWPCRRADRGQDTGVGKREGGRACVREIERERTRDVGAINGVVGMRGSSREEE
jgi:hypothetical protein